MVSLMVNNLHPLQRATYLGELTDDMNILDYLMSQVPLLKSKETAPCIARDPSPIPLHLLDAFIRKTFSQLP